MTLAEYSDHQVATLIDKIVTQSKAVEASASAKSVHDLRVSIRRLSETLRAFEDVFPGRSAKIVRKEVKSAMRLAGQARNYDIAVSLRRKAKLSPNAGFAQERAKIARKLSLVLRQWSRTNAAQAWRELLHAT